MSNVVGVANKRPPMTARASAAFCSPRAAEGQRQHADDHGGRGHQDRTNTSATGADRSVVRRHAGLLFLARK